MTYSFGPALTAHPINAAVGLASDPMADVRSEHGVGAVIPWAGALWAQTYLANTNSTYGVTGANGSGAGLWRVGDDMRPVLVAQDDGCHPCAYVHKETSLLLIGNHIVDRAGNVTPIFKFTQAGSSASERVVGYARHMTSPATKVYAFTMLGLLFEIDLTNVATLAASNTGVTFLSDAGTVLGMTATTKHGKAIWTATGAGRVYVVFNNMPTTAGNADGGRLASWNGTTWSSQDTTNSSWINVAGSYMEKAHVWATGADANSVLLYLFNGQTAAAPRQFRIPFPTDMRRHYFQQEWMRLKAVNTEQYLLDAHGGWFLLSPVLTGDDTFGTGGQSFGGEMPRLEAVSRHLRTYPDFTVYRGQLVLGTNDVSEQYGQFPNAGQSSSGLLYGQVEDLWRMGKPAGVGHWWKNVTVSAGQESLPMLARGYDRKTVHLINHSTVPTATDVTVTAYHEKTGVVMATQSAVAGSGGYYTYTLPAGYGCDWLTVKSSAAVPVTAWVTYN